MSTMSTKYKLPRYKLYTNIYILPPWDVFHSKGVLLYCYGPPEHSVVLVRRVL